MTLCKHHLQRKRPERTEAMSVFGMTLQNGDDQQMMRLLRMVSKSSTVVLCGRGQQVWTLLWMEAILMPWTTDLILLAVVRLLCHILLQKNKIKNIKLQRQQCTILLQIFIYMIRSCLSPQLHTPLVSMHRLSLAGNRPFATVLFPLALGQSIHACHSNQCCNMQFFNFLTGL